jgi:hypothetical protein
MDAGDWYLEVNGKKVGPFTLDQIQGLLEDREIRAYHQVTSNDMGGRWISVDELLQSHAPPPPPSDFATEEIHQATQMISAPPAVTFSPDGSFQPPPRPEIEASAPIDDRTDPAVSLFNALQISRERKAALNLPSVKPVAPRKPLFKVPNMPNINIRANMAAIKAQIPVTWRMWVAAALLGIVLGSLSWGLIKYFKAHPHLGPGSLTQVQNNTLQPPPKVIEPPKRLVPPPPVPVFHPGGQPTVTRPGNETPNENPQPPPQMENYPPPEQNPYPPQDNGSIPQQVPPQPPQNFAPPMGGDPNGLPAGEPPATPQNWVDPNNPPPPPQGNVDTPGQDAFPAPPPPPQQ